MRIPPSLFLALLTGCGGLTAAGGDPTCDPAVANCTAPTTPTGWGDEDCTNGADDDDDGDADCADSECSDKPACDADGDGAADETRGGDDCDDDNADVYPGAPEICDQADNDCDGNDDEDEDGDGSDACDDCDNDDPARYPGATDPCGDGVDANCDGDDVCNDWAEDFESGALSADWTTGGTAAMRVGVTAHAGSWAMVNADISDSQTSCASVTLTFASAGTVDFWHAGDTESCCDFLEFTIDGVSGGSWSGLWTWTAASVPVAAGTHDLMWCYTKDISISTTTDAVFVDDIVAIGGGL